MSSLQRKVAALLKGEVHDDEKTLQEYSVDASLFCVRPQLVVAPKGVDDLKALVAFAAKEKEAGNDVSLTARSAGTDMTGGPLGESIIIDFTKHFDHIKNVSEDAATAEPGVYFRDFDKETMEIDRFMPSYPASRELCTIGGMVGNNAAGEKTLSYGKTADYVSQLNVVLADGNEYTVAPLTLDQLEEKKKLQTFEGEIYRKTHELIDGHYEDLMAAKPTVSKNSSGYALWDVLDKERGVFDLTRLLTGSQGTLGLIDEITFTLVKPKTHSRLVVIFLKDMGMLAKLINAVLATKPESFESYDDHVFKIALRLFPQIVKRLGGNIFMLGIRFIPEFLAVLTGGVPKLVLLAEYTAETDEEALRLATEAAKTLEPFGLPTRVTKSDADAEKYWTIRRESFNLLRRQTKTSKVASFIEDIVVRPEKLPEFLPKLYEILDAYPFTYTIQGHVGDGNFHIFPLMDLTDPKTPAVIKEIMAKVNKLIDEYNGSYSGEHNDGILRTPFLAELFGNKIVALFEETKQIFDPHNIFNPGKKVGGSEAYMEQHIDTRPI